MSHAKVKRRPHLKQRCNHFEFAFLFGSSLFPESTRTQNSLHRWWIIRIDIFNISPLFTKNTNFRRNNVSCSKPSVFVAQFFWSMFGSGEVKSAVDFSSIKLWPSMCSLVVSTSSKLTLDMSARSAAWRGVWLFWPWSLFKETCRSWFQGWES